MSLKPYQTARTMAARTSSFEKEGKPSITPFQMGIGSVQDGNTYLTRLPCLCHRDQHLSLALVWLASVHGEQVVDNHDVTGLPGKEQLAIATNRPDDLEIPYVDFTAITVGNVVARTLFAGGCRIKAGVVARPHRELHALEGAVPLVCLIEPALLPAAGMNGNGRTSGTRAQAEIRPLMLGTPARKQGFHHLAVAGLEGFLPALADSHFSVAVPQVLVVDDSQSLELPADGLRQPVIDDPPVSYLRLATARRRLETAEEQTIRWPGSIRELVVQQHLQVLGIFGGGVNLLFQVSPGRVAADVVAQVRSDRRAE